MEYDLDSLECRRMQLAGTVPFPAPFPTVGTIGLKAGKSTMVIDDPVRFDNKVTRLVYLKDVAAIFVPDPPPEGDWSDPCCNKCIDFEKGTWYLGDNVTAGIADSIGSETFPAIVFVEPDAPVLSKIDLTLTAAESCLVDLPMLLKAGCLGCPCRP